MNEPSGPPVTASPPSLFQNQEEYDHLRRALILFFRSNGSTECHDHADETILRVYNNHRGGAPIENLRAYTYAVARNVLHEYRRGNIRRLEPCPYSDGPSELRLRCLEVCMKRILSRLDCKLIKSYYSGQGRRLIDKRAKLASAMKLAPEALRMRVKRIREKIEPCVKECEEKQGT